MNRWIFALLLCLLLGACSPSSSAPQPPAEPEPAPAPVETSAEPAPAPVQEETPAEPAPAPVQEETPAEPEPAPVPVETPAEPEPAPVPEEIPVEVPKIDTALPNPSTGPLTTEETEALSQPEEEQPPAEDLFREYLWANLTDEQVSDIRIEVWGGYEKCIWIVDREALDAVVSAYTGPIPFEYEVIQVPYSRAQILAAVEEVKASPYYAKAEKKNLFVGRGGVYCSGGALKVLLAGPYPDFEAWLQETYGDMLQLEFFDPSINPAT